MHAGGAPELPPSGGMGGAPPPGGAGYYAPPRATGSRPAVILWYRVYAIVSLLLYAAFAVVVAAFEPEGAPNLLPGILTLLPILAIFGVGAAVPFKPWGWTYGLVMIGFGMLSCFAPLSVLLIIFWSRPEVKAAFGRI